MNQFVKILISYVISAVLAFVIGYSTVSLCLIHGVDDFTGPAGGSGLVNVIWLALLLGAMLWPYVYYGYGRCIRL